jgi:hypothetical protein
VTYRPIIPDLNRVRLIERLGHSMKRNTGMPHLWARRLWRQLAWRVIDAKWRHWWLLICGTRYPCADQPARSASVHSQSVESRSDDYLRGDTIAKMDSRHFNQDHPANRELKAKLSQVRIWAEAARAAFALTQTRSISNSGLFVD